MGSVRVDFDGQPSRESESDANRIKSRVRRKWSCPVLGWAGLGDSETLFLF